MSKVLAASAAALRVCCSRQVTLKSDLRFAQFDGRCAHTVCTRSISWIPTE